MQPLKENYVIFRARDAALRLQEEEKLRDHMAKKGTGQRCLQPSPSDSIEDLQMLMDAAAPVVDQVLDCFSELNLKPILSDRTVAGGGAGGTDNDDRSRSGSATKRKGVLFSIRKSKPGDSGREDILWED